jgi:hypothetical protein
MRKPNNTPDAIMSRDGIITLATRRSGIDVRINNGLYSRIKQYSRLAVSIVPSHRAVYIYHLVPVLNDHPTTYVVAATPTIRALHRWADEYMDLIIRLCGVDATDDDHAAMSAAVAELADLDEHDTVQMHDADEFFARHPGWQVMSRAEQEELICEYSDDHMAFWARGGY